MVKLITFTPEPLKVLYLATRQCTSYDPTNWAYDEEKAIKLIKNAIAAGHESILEHVMFTFRICDISRSCTHQLVRHRLASYCQVSQRYTNQNDIGTTIPYAFKKIPGLFDKVESLIKEIKDLYAESIEAGIAKEDARYILPEGTNTSIVVTMNGRELTHFFHLRCCNRAQWEIRNVANGMLKAVKKAVPVIFDNVGPKCWAVGHCTEQRKCSQYDPETDMCVKEEKKPEPMPVKEEHNMFGISKSIYTEGE